MTVPFAPCRAYRQIHQQLIVRNCPPAHPTVRPQSLTIPRPNYPSRLQSSGTNHNHPVQARTHAESTDRPLALPYKARGCIPRIAPLRAPTPLFATAVKRRFSDRRLLSLPPSFRPVEPRTRTAHAHCGSWNTSNTSQNGFPTPPDRDRCKLSGVGAGCRVLRLVLAVPTTNCPRSASRS